MQSTERSARHGLARLLQFDWLLLLVTAPVLLFPERFSAALISLCLAAWAALWLARALSDRRPFVSSALNIPILCLLLMLPVSVLVSADFATSLPKVTGLLFGIALYDVTLRLSARDETAPPVVAAWAVTALAIALFSFLSTDWTVKVPLLSQLAARIPHLFSNISPTAQNGLQPNEVGGILALLVPAVVSVLLARRPIGVQQGATNRRVTRLIEHWLYPESRAGRITWLIGCLLLVLLLALTQSRSAIFGTALGLLLIVVVRSRAARWLTLSASAVILIAVAALGPSALADTLIGNVVSLGGLDVASRQEVWQHALYAIQDFPFTGLGLNQFERVISLLYPFFFIGPDVRIPHAHNMFLQMALDFGLAGLVAYVGILSASAVMVARAYRRLPDGVTRALLLGFGAGLLAHAGYGLSDAITLGAKPSFEWWWSLAIIAGICARVNATPATERRVSALDAILVWCLASLLAIAFVGDNALLGVALAILGGCAFGAVAVLQWKVTSGKWKVID